MAMGDTEALINVIANQAKIECVPEDRVKKIKGT
jgi:hypothetical protein